jgi:beta-lactamase superfamily II metal-dependent hydrolase
LDDDADDDCFAPLTLRMQTMNRRLLLAAPLLALAVWWGCGAAPRGADARQDPKPLRIVFVDVEGGAATLIVTPLGESVLVDTGWPGFDGRDAQRIRRAAQAAGVSRIDNLVTTHWHTDHYGGVEQLAALMPIARFWDRGIPDSLADDARGFPVLIAAYKKATGGKSTTLRPGNRIPLRAGETPLALTCLVASGQVVDAGASDKPNPQCAGAATKDPDPSDNAKSLGLRLDFGPFRFLDLGDLTWNVEQQLVCPSNRIGKIDLFQVTHHGSEQSNNPVLVRSIRPRVAVIDNGPRKGGAAETFATLKATTGLEAIFQLHRNLATGEADNTAPAFIANLAESCQGQPIQADVAPDGKQYTITLGGKDAKYTYATRE